MSKTKASEFLLRAAQVDSTECIDWPFARNSFGYGLVRYEGSPRLAHRTVCRIVHGQPASPDMEAAHSCGNRACVNWRHLRWATHTENMADKIADGTSRTTVGERHGAAKLTEADVRSVLDRLAAGEAMTLIARDYGVTPTAVGAIKKGRTWASVPREPK